MLIQNLLIYFYTLRIYTKFHRLHIFILRGYSAFVESCLYRVTLSRLQMQRFYLKCLLEGFSNGVYDWKRMEFTLVPPWLSLLSLPRARWRSTWCIVSGWSYSHITTVRRSCESFVPVLIVWSFVCCQMTTNLCVDVCLPGSLEAHS